MKPLLLVALLCLQAAAQPADTAKSDPEEQALNSALAETGSSPFEFIRALEKHLAKFPDSKRRAELERALVKASIDTNDRARLILYGERVLARQSDDIQILDKVIRALFQDETPENARKALKHANRYEELVTSLREQQPPVRMSATQWQMELDKGVAIAATFQAHAKGILGELEAAVNLARKGYVTYGSAESARELGRWLAAAGKNREAVDSYADAFTIQDSKNTDGTRALDRIRMGEVYSKLHGSEKGLGDLVLQAYDRTAQIVAERNLKLRQADPNSQATRLMDFTLSGLDGGKLQLSSLKGKVVVFDFWATWCAPCRIQHPLYEQVKKQFTDASKVVFLSVNTDEDRSVVRPFLDSQKWGDAVWFEDGLSRLLQVSSIPTTIIADKRGEIVSRMNGYVPDRFVDMLSERINEALGK